MKQSRLMSLVEATTNTLIGWGISVIVGQTVIYPYFGYEVTVMDNMGMTAAFVAVSLARSYLFRRLFEWMHRR